MITIIRRAWLPRTLAGLAIWYANFALKFAQFADELGLANFVGQVDKDNLHVQWLAGALEAGEANNRQLKQFRDESLFAEMGDPAPAAPITTLPAAPEAFQTSILHRLVDLVEKKIETADNFTEAIGTQLGIVVPTSEKIAPASVKPGLTIHEAETGYVFTVVAANRADSDSVDVYALRKGAANWEKIGTFTGKSVDLTWNPTTPGLAEQFQCRIQGRKNNQNYGQPSDIVNVTAKP